MGTRVLVVPCTVLVPRQSSGVQPRNVYTVGSFAVHSRVLSHKKYDSPEIMHCFRKDQFHILCIELEIAWNLG